ncbi:hypothetical protein [Foetidibacter luteolus]|uniref:hypothetical protein n=1 Tax=Foetidibacter luteolus TaxID=2608880 RepID=UPI00129AAEB0|nr:hypothetical protein [Foetidibacter luteolus]
MSTVTFTSYIDANITMHDVPMPVTGQFIQWANSYIEDKEGKIPVTVALVRMDDGTLLLANPLGMVFNN